MNFFSSNYQDENSQLNPSTSNSAPTSANTNNNQNSYFKAITNVFSSKEEPKEPETLKEKIIAFFEVEKSYTSFFIVLAFGFVILFFSLMFLPFVLLSPQKFVSLFSIGSFLILSSFIFIYGTKDYLNMLFNSSRTLLTCLYLASIIVGIYFSFVNSWMFVSHICAVLQLITLITFTLSFIPGGNMGISFMWNMFKSMFVRGSDK